MAMLVVLETLSPLEQAVFVLREAIGMPHVEIAEVLGRKEEAVRQLARRARDRVREGGAWYDADQLTRRLVTERFLEATVGGDLEALMGVLAPGVTLAPRRRDRGADGAVPGVRRELGEPRRARPYGPGERGTGHRGHLRGQADHGAHTRRGRRLGAYHPPSRQPREAGRCLQGRGALTDQRLLCLRWR